MKRKDLASIVVIVAILVVIALYVFGNYQRGKSVEVREVNTEQYSFKVPPGFRYITSAERKSFGFSQRVTVLTKGDFGELILADLETGLPELLKSEDIRENLRLHKKELEKATFDFKLISQRSDIKDFSYTIEYQGKTKEGIFQAILYSKMLPGKKFNVTISGPEGSLARLRKEMKIIKESLVLK